MNNDLFFSSKSDEWATPQEIFNVLNEEFDFNLDPCATAENAKCPIFYTKEDNGIVKNWGGAECFAILRIPKLGLGLRRLIEKAQKTELSLFCLFQREQILAIFTILFCIVPRSVLSVEG